MAGKQSKYLAGILSDDDGDQSAELAPSPAPEQRERSRGLTLLGRESALARVSSGKVTQVTQHLLDPARVRVWPGNARVYAHLTEENTRELIDSILAEGGQKVPAIVRRVTDDPNHDFEVIAGTRRHFAVSWLRTNSYPDISFLAQVAELDDEAAFRIADLENRARKDVSDLERARNYAAALGDHYGGHLTRMAERLRLSKGWLSKMIKVARIPDAVIDAFASPADLQLKPAYPLAQALDDKTRAKAIKTEARLIVAQQEALRNEGLPALAAPEVLRRLLSAPEAYVVEDEPYRAASRYGRDMLTLQSMNRQGVTVRLHAGSGADRDELIEALRKLLEHVEAHGEVSLR
jgi:ParB family chromosome partitioning protein